jgi:hypothetical protein
MQIRTLIGIVVLSLASPLAQPPLSQGVIEQDLWIPPPPLHQCAVPELAGRVLDALSTVGGLEYLPGRCNTASGPGQPASVSGRVNLRGLTAREAFDRLVEADPRFRWTSIDGVMVIRPIDAWRDPDHFLNRTVSLAFSDQNVGGALYALLNAIGPGKFRTDREHTFSTAEANRVFSVSVSGTSTLAALNAVVRTHGGLKWGVGYCQPQRRVEFARIFLHTFDSAGIAGQPAAGLSDENSVAQDPCVVPARE